MKSIMKLQDPMSGLTHFIGIILSIIGLILLIYKSSIPIIKPWHIVTFAVYGAGLILLYTSSTLYHWLPLHEKGNKRLQKLDHAMIFILIAATYTPVCLIPLRGGWGWSLFGAIWALAITGIILEIFSFNPPRWIVAIIYVLMGWLIIIGVYPIIQTLQLAGFLWILLGGILYTVGALIYAIKKPDPWPEFFGFHEIFHLFVLAGSMGHFWAMYKYILPY